MTQVNGDKERTGPVAVAPGTETSGRVAAEVALQQTSRQARAVSLVREAALLPVLVLLIIVGALSAPFSSPCPTSPASACRPRLSG